MPETQDIPQTLAQFQRELERLRPAIRHLEAAERATEMAGAIIGAHQAALQRVQTDFTSDLRQVQRLAEIRFSDERKTVSETLAAQRQLVTDALTSLKGDVDTLLTAGRGDQARTQTLQSDIAKHYEQLLAICLEERLADIETQLQTLHTAQLEAAKSSKTIRTYLLMLMVVAVVTLCLAGYAAFR